MSEQPSTAEREAIRRTCLDYAEGFFEGDADRLREALHPELVKRTVDGGSLDPLGREELIESATGEDREMPTITVAVDDVHDGIATATIVSAYVDYVHLARIDGGWMIVNALWEPA